MKKFLNIFFVTLGVIFFLLIIGGIVVYFTDPLGLWSVEVVTKTDETTKTTGSATTVDKNPALNAAQEKALETFGIDPATVPTSITPAQEACFIEKLGASRVEEIKAGATPSMTDYFKANGCI